MEVILLFIIENIHILLKLDDLVKESCFCLANAVGNEVKFVQMILKDSNICQYILTISEKFKDSNVIHFNLGQE